MMIKSMVGRIAAGCAALLMAAALPLAALAQDGGQTGRMFFGGGMPMVDEGALTADQQAAYAQAKADYEAIEDQQLANLVAAGTITQADVDAYVQQRAEGRQAPSGGQAQQRQRVDMTDEQRTALMQAMQSDNRDQAIADLVAQGVITQEQADQMAQMPQADGQGMGGSGNLWARIRQAAEADTAASIAVNNIHVAAQNMQQALNDAGIQMPQMGQMPADAQTAP